MDFLAALYYHSTRNWITLIKPSIMTSIYGLVGSTGSRKFPALSFALALPSGRVLWNVPSGWVRRNVPSVGGYYRICRAGGTTKYISSGRVLRNVPSRWILQNKPSACTTACAVRAGTTECAVREGFYGISASGPAMFCAFLRT